MFGYDHVGLPATLDALGVGRPDLETRYKKLYDIVLLELWRGWLYNDGSVPSYPVIKGSIWPRATVQRLMKDADAMGHEGVILQGTESLLEYPGI